MIFLSLINNVTLIIALSILYSFVIRRWEYGSRISQAISGLLFGVVAVVGMMNPLIISPGLIFDGRSIIISVAGFIGGWVTALIAALMSIIYRTWLGGPGAIMGVSVVTSSAAIGIVYHYIRRRRPHVATPLSLIGFGIIVHICMLALTMTLPSGMRYEVLSNIAIPVILIYPLGTVLVLVVLLDLESRLHAEYSLKKSEEKYRLVVENADEAILIAQDGLLKYVNPMTLKILGYSEDLLTSRPFVEIIHPEDREKLFEAHSRRMRGEETQPVQQFRAIAQDGTFRLAASHAIMISWEGKPATLNYITDITERKRAEETLRESQEKYRWVVDNMADAITVMDMDLRFTYVSPSIMRMRGYTAEEATAQTFEQVMTPESLQIIAKVFEEEMKLEASGTADPGRSRILELEEYRKDGSIVWMENNLSFMRDEAQKPVGIISLSRDITDRKRAEEAIVVAKNDWENTFDAVTDMITIHDIDFNIIRANPAAKAMLGLQLLEEMPLAKCFRLYHGTEKPPSGCVSCQSLQTGRSSIVEIFEPHLNKYLEIRAMPRFGSDGRLVGLIHVVRDITERKKADKQLQDTLESLRKALGTIIQVMVSAVDARDPYTAGHQVRSANIARAIATEMGLPQETIDGIRMAGSIHDIGKLSIPAEILSKPGKLSVIEFSLIKEHARRGFEMLKDVESPWPLAEIVYQHHERMDGSGYPRKLKGDDILMEARIMAVADVVESMASHRPYRPALGINAALEEIEKNKKTLYDDTVADACLRLFREKGFKIEVA
jgi:PAS domain S-box-containing protein